MRSPSLKPGDSIRIAGHPVRLAVNTRARTLGLRFDTARGEVTATAPSARRLPEAADFARRRAEWIVRHLETLPPAQPFQPEAVIPFRGAPCRLKAAEGAGAARLSPGARTITSGGEGEAFSRRVLNLLKREALADLKARSAVHASALRVPTPHISVFDAAGRWGSCTPAAGRIRYSWRVICAPPFVADYLTAHECAHLVEPNHSRRFWAQVARLVGDHTPARQWLKENGAALHAIGRCA
jgi:predicted metal-dependent hydrolase